MALRPNRIHVDSQIDFFMDDVAERGGIVSISTTGSGVAMDQGAQLCEYAANPSGVSTLGVLMCDVVNLDLTRQHENFYKEEVQKGGKVTIWNKGTVLTDMIYPGTTPTAGQIAYVAHSGYIAPTDIVSDSSTMSHEVGRFMSTKDEDGFCKVSINLP